MSSKCPIAVVGVSALFPGAAEVTGFWHDLLKGKDHIREIPESYWLIDDYYDADPKAEDKTYGKRGAFIDPVGFDCLEFGMLPAQVQDTDSVQLMALIVAQSVMRDAAKGDYAHIDRERMSVILGVAGGTEQLVQMGARLQRPVWLKSLREAGIAEDKAQEICNRIADHYVPWSEASFPGLLGNVVAGRIANRFDLGGTNCVVDAACASSSSALSMAVNELYLGNSDFVIAGGADALNDILMYMCFSKTPALSPTGDCRPFSDQADGTILGEGVGMVALRRLEDAERDGDTIYAVIKGVGSSSDGAGTAVYAPVSEGQAKAIKRAYEYAGFDPGTIELIEAHGTGTKAGDKAEFNGLNIAFGTTDRDDKQWCALGSVKSQIGHTKGAAGAASLIKTVLALHHKVLPPTIKVDRPNPAFEIENTPFYINTKTRPWIRDSRYPRRAGVSSFGFGGSNYHVAVEEYVGEQSDPRRIMNSDQHLMLFSADTVDGVFAQASQCLNDVPDDRDALEYLARSAQVAFDALAPYRVALVVEGVAQAKKALDHCKSTVGDAPQRNQQSPIGWSFGCQPMDGKLAFVFPGQGSQYLNMGADIAMTFPQARAVWDTSANLPLDEHQTLAQVVFPRPVFESAQADAQTHTLNATQWAQPAIGVTSLSYLTLMRTLGVKPEAVAGHSYGELTALHAAGVYDAEALLQLARKRGELMAAAAANSEGAMSAVSASREQVQALIDQVDGMVGVANVNSPKQVVISGEMAAVAAVETACDAASIAYARLPVSTAFHSSIVVEALEPFQAYLQSLPFNAPTLPVYANKTAQAYPKKEAAQKVLLAEQLVSPVLFQEQIQTMYADGYRVFIEVGPGNVLTKLIDGCLEDEAHTAIAMDRKHQNGMSSLWHALAQMSVLGMALDYDALWQGFREAINPAERPKPKMSLPITGINYNRAYPPKGGASTLPTPNQNSVAPPPNAPVQAPPAQPAPTPQIPAGAGLDSQQRSEWLAAFERIQQQTNESHRQFLQLTERALDQLGQLAGGTPAPSAYASRPAVPAPAPYVPPVAPAPLAPVATPMPVASAPSQPAPVPQPVVSAAPVATDVNGVMLDIVAEKTGYPLEMLQMSMDLENDLGIDSIKRVEILSATIEQLPDLPPVNPSDMASLRTLQEVADFIAGQLGSNESGSNESESLVSEPVSAPAVSEGIDINAIMLSVVAEKTGYPLEMLEPGMDLENDLGIDSIKRVEILSATTQQVPNLPPLEAADMATLRTLAEVSQFIADKAGVSSASTPVAQEATADPKSDTGSEPAIRRYELVLEPFAAPGLLSEQWLAVETLIITPSHSVYAQALADEMGRRGYTTALRDTLQAGDRHAVCLDALQRFESPVSAMAVNGVVFDHACTVASELEAHGGVFIAVQDTGGDYGQRGNPGVQAWSGGLSGLVKTAAQEWPNALVRSLDVALAGRDPTEIATAIADELLNGGTVLEVALGVDGQRYVPVSVAAEVNHTSFTLSDGDVVLVTGGGRGVTAAAVTAWSEQQSLRFVLLGRTELDQDTRFDAYDDEPSLMKAVLADAQARGQTLNPAQLKRAVGQILANRDIRHTLMSLKDRGAEAQYQACDLNDAQAVSALVSKVQQQWGPIKGLVHGAGVLADKRLSSKTPEHFQTVFGTKVGGLATVLEALDVNALSLVCLFSSVAARAGNVGQSDYAMANEVLNRVASQISASTDAKVVSINWGPWDSGMVNDALKQKFADLGVGLIPLIEGAHRFVEELQHPAHQAVDVVIGGAPLNRPLADPNSSRNVRFQVTASAQCLPHLDSHRVRGNIVLPMVQVIDWFVGAVNVLSPSVQDVELTQLKVLRGVTLQNDESQSLTVQLEEQQAGDFFATLLDSAGAKRYSAQLRFVSDVPTATPTVSHAPYVDDFDPYAKRLFHGPLFESLGKVEGLDSAGARARLAGGQSLNWAPHGWCVDQAMLDGALQLALVWGYEQIGHDSLPMSIDRLRIGHRGLTSGAASCVLQAHRTDTSGTQSDLWIVDDRDQVLASVSGLHMVAVNDALK